MTHCFCPSKNSLSTFSLLPGGRGKTIICVLDNLSDNTFHEAKIGEQCKLFPINIISKLVCVPISVVLSLFFLHVKTIHLGSQDVVVHLKREIWGEENYSKKK